MKHIGSSGGLIVEFISEREGYVRDIGIATGWGITDLDGFFDDFISCKDKTQWETTSPIIWISEEEN